MTSREEWEWRLRMAGPRAGHDPGRDEPDQQRRGLGRQVLRALLKRAKRHGCSSAALEVAASNQAAIGLYGALGFVSCGQRSGYYRNGEDALLKCIDLEHIHVRTVNRPK